MNVNFAVKDVMPVVSLQGTYLPSCSSALRYAAGAVRVFVLLEIHESVSLPLDVRLVDVIQGLQAFSSHGCVPSVQGGGREPTVGVVGKLPAPAPPTGSQAIFP